MALRVIFMGTPDFSVPTLRRLVADGHQVVAVYTRAPKPAQKWDPRLFGIGAQILRELQVGQMRLMANPRKIPSMTGFGLEITGLVDKN